MAHLKPPMTLSESDWFDRTPKAVLFEIARQFAMLVADKFDQEAALAAMAKEWATLHDQGLVPQEPARVRTEEQIIATWPAYARERYLQDANNHA